MMDCKDEICPTPCGDHGRCVFGKCMCMQGWTGPNCKDPQCPGSCSGHGMCGFSSSHAPGECTCDYGWAGAACQRTALYTQIRSCPNDCNGNGLCMNGMCACNVGFNGVDCSGVECDAMSVGTNCDMVRCPGDCHGQGLCMNGVCACWEAFTGGDCSMPVECYELCRNTCDPDGSSEKCTFCVGQCQTVHGHSELGVHNGFEDLRATLLQSNKSRSLPPTSPRFAAPPAAKMKMMRQMDAGAASSSLVQHNQKHGHQQNATKAKPRGRAAKALLAVRHKRKEIHNAARRHQEVHVAKKHKHKEVSAVHVAAHASASGGHRHKEVSAVKEVQRSASASSGSAHHRHHHEVKTEKIVEKHTKGQGHHGHHHKEVSAGHHHKEVSAVRMPRS